MAAEATAKVRTQFMRVTIDLGVRAYPAGALGELLAVLHNIWLTEYGDETQLVVSDIRKGSLIFEFAVVALTGTVGLAAGTNSLIEFAQNVSDRIGRLKSARYKKEIEPTDYQLGRALAAFVKEGGSITLHASDGAERSAYARVSSESLDHLASVLSNNAGPPALAAAGLDDRVRKNVVIWFTAEGDGCLAFVPSVCAKPLPVEFATDEDLDAYWLPSPAARGDAVVEAEFDMTLMALTSIEALGETVTPASAARDRGFRADIYRGTGWRGTVIIRPGTGEPAGYAIVNLDHRIDR